eukprot:2869617-Rhodomonas_salina.1
MPGVPVAHGATLTAVPVAGPAYARSTSRRTAYATAQVLSGAAWVECGTEIAYAASTEIRYAASTEIGYAVSNEIGNAASTEIGYAASTKIGYAATRHPHRGHDVAHLSHLP